VLFLMNGSTVIDESNDFYGASNNGRDCIIKAQRYEYDLTACIFQNDLVGYNGNDYYQGLVQTSGIARYVDKFSFSLRSSSGNTPIFALIPLADADFDFYIDSDGTICPSLANYDSDYSGCTFTFVFTGTGTPLFAGEPLLFDSQQSATITTGFGLFHLTIGNPPRDCMLLNCMFSAEYSTITLDPPPYTLISASDLALQTKIYNAIDQNMNGTLTTLRGIVGVGYSLGDSYKNLSKQLAALNFNTTKIQYQDFTALRAQVDALINNISSDPVDNWDLDGSGCSGIFGGITCFFQSLANTIVTIIIVVVCVCVGYIVCFKLGLAKIITKKLFGSK